MELCLLVGIQFPPGETSQLLELHFTLELGCSTFCTVQYWLQCVTVLYSTVLTAVWHRTVLAAVCHCTELYSNVQHSRVLCSTILYCTADYNTHYGPLNEGKKHLRNTCHFVISQIISHDML